MNTQHEWVKALLDLTREQIESVIAGDHGAVMRRVSQHEELLQAIDKAPADALDEATIALLSELQTERAKLNSLLHAELTRIDVQMRILAGVRPSSGYPEHRAEQSNRIFNRKV